MCPGCSCRKWSLLMIMIPLALFVLFALLGGCASAAPTAPSAPPLKCELNLSSWCIAEGFSTITREFANDAINSRVWYLGGHSKPRSTMVLLEPSGCESGFSDAIKLLAFDKNYQWKGQNWDRAQIALRADGKCNLTVLLPPNETGQGGWFYSTGLILIRPCVNDSCLGPSFSEIRDEIAFAARR